MCIADDGPAEKKTEIKNLNDGGPPSHAARKVRDTGKLIFR
jgi:hypothetical protein